MQQYFQVNSLDKLLWKVSTDKGNGTVILQYHKNANAAEKSYKIVLSK